MKIKIDRKAFLESFAVVASAAAPKSPMEVVRNVLMVVGGDADVVLTATDMNLWVTMPAKGIEVGSVAEPGAVLVDASKLKQALEGMRGDEVTIESDDSAVVVRQGKTHVRLPTDDPQKFPLCPSSGSLPPKWPVPSAILPILADRVGYAVNDKSMSTAVGGIKMEVDEGELGFVGLDGNRMARKVISNKGPIDKINAHIPPSAFRLAAKVFDDSDSCLIAFTGPSLAGPHMVHFVGSDGAQVSSRLLEGRFPLWRKGIPDPDTKQGTAKVKVADLMGAIRVAMIATTESSSGITFRFDADDVFTLEASAPDAGDSEVECPCEYAGIPGSVQLSGSYARSSVEKLDPKSTVEIDFYGDDRVVLIRGEGNYMVGMSPMVEPEG